MCYTLVYGILLGMNQELLEKLKTTIEKLQQLAERILQEEISFKRTHNRLPYRVPLEYSIYQTSLAAKQIPADYGQTQKSVAKDISAGGIMFGIPKPLPLGIILKMKIDMSFVNRTVECLVRIVRLEEIKEDGKYAGKYNASVCFLDISTADKKIIDGFVQEEREAMKKRIVL